MRVGIPRTPNWEAMSGLSSTFSLATRTFPSNSFAHSPRRGAPPRAPGPGRLVLFPSPFRELLHHAEVHHHGDARLGEALSGMLVHDALLHPEIFCADPDRLLGDCRDLIRFPET